MYILGQVQSDADRRVDRERREVEGRLKHHIDQLQRRVDSLAHHNQELTEKKLRAENSVKWGNWAWKSVLNLTYLTKVISNDLSVTEEPKKCVKFAEYFLYFIPLFFHYFSLLSESYIWDWMQQMKGWISVGVI